MDSKVVDEKRTLHLKPGKNVIFLKNGKNSKIDEMIQGSLEIFLDLQ